jgi:hypothetical protein
MILSVVFGAYDLIVFLLVFTIVYGLLSRSKFFTASDLPALIALAVAFAALASSFFVAFILQFLPYVLAILVFLFLILLLLYTIGVPSEAVSGYLKKSTLVPAILVLVMFIFGLIAFGNTSALFYSSTSHVVSTTSHPTSVNSSSSGAVSSISSSTTFPSYLNSAYVLGILTNPSVLSLLLTLGAMAVAVYAMTRETPH